MPTLASAALVAYPVHINLFDDSLKKEQWMIDNRHTLVGLLPVCCSEDELEKEETGEGDDILANQLTTPTIVPLKEGVHVIEVSERREN